MTEELNSKMESAPFDYEALVEDYEYKVKHGINIFEVYSALIFFSIEKDLEGNQLDKLFKVAVEEMDLHPVLMGAIIKYLFDHTIKGNLFIKDPSAISKILGSMGIKNLEDRKKLESSYKSLLLNSKLASVLTKIL